MIKNYFNNYEILSDDITIEIGSKKRLIIHNSCEETGWQITLANTGDEAMTGARVKRIQKYVNDDTFLLTYGDGVANIDIDKLFEFHKSHGKIGTVTGVHPSSRFGELVVEDDQVVEFTEKPQIKEGIINGGFFVYSDKFFNYLSDDDSCILEREPLERLASDGELMVYKHEGYWQCMDTYRDYLLLNEAWHKQSPWKSWG